MILFFFFKQKTAYEMRISDWSSDVCSSDLLVAAELRRSNFKRRDQVLTGRVAVQRQRLDAYDAETVFIGGGIERQTNIIWQKKWVWAFGAEMAATRENDTFSPRGRPDTRTYFYLRTTPRPAHYGSDALLNPPSGF